MTAAGMPMPAERPSLANAVAQRGGNTQWTLALHTLRAMRVSTMLSSAMLLVVAGAALLAPVVAPYDPVAQLDLASQNAGPSIAHPLGLDSFARDVLSRLLYGARSSLTIACIATACATALGAAWGAIAATAGGTLRDLMLGLVDVLRVLPRLLVLLVVFVIFGALSPAALGFALGLTCWPAIATLIDARVRHVRALPFTEAAVALGASPMRVLLRQVAPHLAGTLGATATLLLADVLSLEAGLSFIGLGVRAPRPSWGGMIQDALPYLGSAPLGVAIPAVTIVCVVLATTRLAGAGSRR